MSFYTLRLASFWFSFYRSPSEQERPFRYHFLIPFLTLDVINQRDYVGEKGLMGNRHWEITIIGRLFLFLFALARRCRTAPVTSHCISHRIGVPRVAAPAAPRRTGNCITRRLNDIPNHIKSNQTTHLIQIQLHYGSLCPRWGGAGLAYSHPHLERRRLRLIRISAAHHFPSQLDDPVLLHA